jgi:phosphoesterase RecJ-like protein
MKEVVALLREAQRITAICHENPDADTLGAAIAIAIAAERMGKAAEVVSGDPPPPLLSFVPGIDRVRNAPALEPDVAVVVDAGDLARTGSIAVDHADWLVRARIANVDHHVSNTGFGSASWVDPTAAATCEMVALLLPELGVAIDRELATVLMTGIAQDTHTFAHPNATPRTLRVAADLLEAGAPLSAINRTLYVDKPYSTLALWGLMLAEVGEEPTAGEGFVDLLGSTKAADITVLFKEVDDTSTRVSVRTSDRADAVAITAAFGGGGHARAAGCTVIAPLAEARDRVLAECERELARIDAGSR